ncbi:MAG: glycosyltransferase [Bacteroidota bacterium]|nr:glycosyltransferase [Sphingobacteriales bacterium]
MSKILIVGPAYPLRGGLATYNERLAKEFNAMGHTCHILSFSLQYPSLLFPGKTQYSTDSAPADITIYSEINSINPFNWISIGRKIKKASYDIVIFRYWMSFMAPAFGTIASIIRQNKHTRILTICDNLIPHEQKFFDKPFTGYFMNKCDGYLTMSQAVKQQLMDWPVNKPVVYSPHPMYDMFGAPLAKADARKNLGLDNNIRYLLFFGFIRKYKGLHLLLDAFADARVRQLNIKLIVAGEFYEDAKPYLEQIEKLSLSNHVILSNDFIPNSGVSNYFCAADAVIQTYLHATQSGVTQIAYFYNKPMIVTNVGGLAELVPDKRAGLVVETNKEAIANAICDFYNQNMEVPMQKELLIEKQKFTWSYLCNKLLSL